jgi:hypothetical protein
MGEFVVGEPHVSRLTPTVSSGQLGDVELEGWVTSSPVMAQNHNSSRSNAPGEGYVRDDDSDDDGIGDGTEDADEELEALYEYLGGEAMVGERFTVCLPDAEVPGGNGSIREAVTPERLVAYLTGEFDGEGRVYSWGTPKAGSEGGGDCDDNERDVFPAAVCGTTPHFVADVTGPVSTGGGMEVVRTEDGSVFLLSSNRTADGTETKVEMQMTLSADPIVAGPDGSDTSCSDDDPCGPGVWARTTESGSSSGVSVYQVMAQPPRCPRPFPAVLYVQRCESNDQLVYTGGWIIDDAALYEDSATVFSMAGPTSVVPVGNGDLDGDGLGDLVERSGAGARALRGARLDSGTVEELVETGVISESGGADIVVRKRPGRRAQGDDGEPGENYRFVAHVSVDAPVLHLASASRASQDVKFKAGAELSKAVN